MYDFHWSNATYMNHPSRASLLLYDHTNVILMVVVQHPFPRGVLLYYHKITEYGIKCCMHAYLEAPRAPPSRGELYRCKTLFLDNFPFFFYPNGTWALPNFFLNFFNFAKPLTRDGLYIDLLFSSIYLFKSFLIV